MNNYIVSIVYVKSTRLDSFRIKNETELVSGFISANSGNEAIEIALTYPHDLGKVMIKTAMRCDIENSQSFINSLNQKC